MKALPLLAGGLLTWCGCAGTETGNPAHDQDVHIAYAPLTTSVELSGGASVTFDEVRLQLVSVVLEACAGQARVELVRERAVELLAGDADVSGVPAASYCALLLTLGGESDSFSASRAVADGETSVAFDSQLQIDVRVDLLEPIAIEAVPVHWILGFDLEEWLGPLEAWLSSDEPRLTVDESAGELKAAIARSITLYDDVDQDGEADAAELDDPVSTASSSAAQLPSDM